LFYQIVYICFRSAAAGHGGEVTATKTGAEGEGETSAEEGSEEQKAEGGEQGTMSITDLLG